MMPDRRITPAQFGAAVSQTLALRATAERSKPFAAVSACRHVGIDEAWAVPIIAFLNDSVFVAESWAKDQFLAAVDAAYGGNDGQS